MYKTALKRVVLEFMLNRQLPISLYKNPICNYSFLPINLKDSFCVINFDDLSPVKKNLFTLERGGNILGSLTKTQESLFLKYPYIGVTHFTIPCCTPSDFIRIFNKDVYCITNPRNYLWLKYYKDLSKRYKIELAIHGFNHRQFINPFFSRHTEFSYTTKNETTKLLNLAKKYFNEAGFESIGFRQPGWDFNPDFSLIDCLINEGFEYAGLSSYDAGLNAQSQRVSFDYPTLINNKLISFPDNINLDWNIEKLKNRVNELVLIKGCIVIKGHFVEKKYTNSFSSLNYEKLCNLLDYIKKTHGDRVEYLTFKEAVLKIKSELT